MEIDESLKNIAKTKKVCEKQLIRYKRHKNDIKQLKNANSETMDANIIKNNETINK